MNSQLEKIINEVVKLDSWDILSILSGVNYMARQNAINAVVRKIPDRPGEDATIDVFADYKEKMQMPELTQEVGPFVRVAERVTEVLNEYTDLKPSGYEEVFDYMTQTPPKRSTYQNDYNARKAAGMRPNVPMSVFIDAEMTLALNRFNDTIAKGEDAVRILYSVEGSDDAGPDWFYERINDKVLQKLEDRWIKAEIRRTNLKLNSNDRDLTAANQKLIETVIQELGGKIPDFSKEMDISDDTDLFIAALQQKAGKTAQ